MNTDRQTWIVTFSIRTNVPTYLVVWDRVLRSELQRDWRCLNVRFDDDDSGDDVFFPFFLSRSNSERSDVLTRFDSERSDVPGGVGSCFEIGTQERLEMFERTIR